MRIYKTILTYQYRSKELEQYLAPEEPGVEERARKWSMAIGLQDVDQLEPSEFLLEQAGSNNIINRTFN